MSMTVRPHTARVRRCRTVVGRHLGALGATALLGCRDASAPGPVTPGGSGPAPQRLLLTTDVPGDTLDQLGLGLSATLSDSAIIHHLTVWVDSGAAGPVAAIGPANGYSYWSTLDVAVHVPMPGTHTITVVADDATGRARSASVTRTFRIADEAYTVAALPDLGAGSGARWVHPAGIVTGWVATSTGRHVPALWRDGALQVIPVPDSLPDDLAAVRTNTAGDVLVQDDSAAANTQHLPPLPRDIYARGASLRRADGVWLRLGPVSRGPDAGDAICCVYARELTESRRALGASYDPPAPASASAVFDVARGTTLDSSLTVRLLVMNAAGQMAGTITPYATFDYRLVTVGFTTSGLPSTVGGGCADLSYTVHPVTRIMPIDLDDAGNLLASVCYTPGYYAQPGGGTSTLLDRAMGEVRQYHLSRRGGLVVGLDTSGTLYVWRAATGRATRLRLNPATWRIRTVGAIAADGTIAAEGTEVATGRRTALRLTRGP